jgi:hypothetical protein
MAEFFIIISDPELRRFAETALEFIKYVYRDEVLADLDFVFVSSTKRRDLDRMWEEAKRLLPPKEVSLAIEGVEDVVLFGVGGPMGVCHTDRPKVIAVALERGRCEDFYVLAHEFAHHVADTYMSELCVALSRDDVPAIGYLAELLSKTEEEELLKFAGEVVRAVQEYAPDYVVCNYFLLMNTSLVMDWGRLRDVDPFDDTIRRVGWYLTRAHLNLKEALMSKKAPADVVREVDRLGREMLKAAEEFRFPSLDSALHSAVSSKVRRWPKDVYLSDPDRYRPLLEGLPVDKIRWRGVPMFT